VRRRFESEGGGGGGERRGGARGREIIKADSCQSSPGASALGSSPPSPSRRWPSCDRTTSQALRINYDGGIPLGARFIFEKEEKPSQNERFPSLPRRRAAGEEHAHAHTRTQASSITRHLPLKGCGGTRCVEMKEGKRCPKRRREKKGVRDASENASLSSPALSLQRRSAHIQPHHH